MVRDTWFVAIQGNGSPDGSAKEALMLAAMVKEVCDVRVFAIRRQEGAYRVRAHATNRAQRATEGDIIRHVGLWDEKRGARVVSVEGTRSGS